MNSPDKPADLALDQDLCMGSGYCARAFPDLFSITDEGIAQLNTHAVLIGKVLHDAHQAAQICPAGAIEISTRNQ